MEDNAGVVCVGEINEMPVGLMACKSQLRKITRGQDEEDKGRKKKHCEYDNDCGGNVDNEDDKDDDSCAVSSDDDDNDDMYASSGSSMNIVGFD